MTEMPLRTHAAAAGRAAAHAALAQRRGRRVPGPSAKLRREWADAWAEFLSGWAEVLKTDRHRQASWHACYQPGQETTMETTIYADRPPVFWVEMGPFFAKRSVRREMPYLIDDEGYVWFLIRQNAVVQGFASLHIDKNDVGHFHGLYVVPDRRQNGVADQLVRERLNYLTQHGISLARTTANAKSLPLLVKHGFVEVSIKGSYRNLEKHLGDKLP